ncbi:hypothetical protein PHYSODRAFT_325107 [Phytophthora sojae]|uniref:Reverse transcriptase n=1 Tax=Phytophthora sojae (strain P6497) TaxID=1094619 RepID=G4YZ83_PHYSP|nr:hypothetical protein PHYSODRAFT_325107 [Phytophthora sojae]EGZ23941.1 hypothetical protein PHYSODRAFT_325107 [Phytophthora sojae]|eukprot:XP_009519229.1 hypothetical protein PHYSODRAFT_325107 [Phytophthora sojae]
MVRVRSTYEDQEFVETFIVLDLDDKFDIVLGMPWLARHDPVIDWEKRTLVRFGRDSYDCARGVVPDDTVLGADMPEQELPALEDGTPAEGDYELLAASPPEQERNQDQNQHNEDDDEELQRRQREDMDMNSRTPIAFEALAERTLFLVARSSSYAAQIAGKCHMFWIQVQMASTGRRANPSTVVGRVSFRFGSSGYSSDNSDELRAVALPLFQSGEEKRRLRRHTPLGTKNYEFEPTYTFDNLALGSKADDYTGVTQDFDEDLKQ